MIDSFKIGRDKVKFFENSYLKIYFGHVGKMS